MKIYKEDTRTYVLLQNGDSSFIIEITARKLTHIYGESWNNGQEEMQKYEELLGKIESQGVEAGGFSMSIKVVRATGMMGGAARVAVKVDNEVVVKLENNEEYTLPFEGDEVNIKVKQFFLGVKKRK